MANRALRVGDVVCFRTGKLRGIRHTICDVYEHRTGQRRFELSLNGRFAGHAQPCKVRLADGAAERMSQRKEALRKRIEDDKAAKRAARKGGRAHVTRSKT